MSVHLHAFSDRGEAFDVYYGATLVNTVYYEPGFTARQVREALIRDHGYTATVSVYKRAIGRHAYSDCARATHPEEL